MKVVTILSMKQLTPQKVKWKLRKKGADLYRNGKVAVKNRKTTKFLP